MKKTIIWVVLLVVVVGLLVVFGGNRYKDDKVFRIGSTESLTGPSAYYGESTKKGIDLAFQEAKDKYSNVNFEIFHADNQFNAKVGVDAYRQLKTEHNIQAIITHTSPASVATLPIAKADGIVQIANSAAAESYSTPDDLSFRTTVGTDKEAKAMADYIDKKCNGSVGILGMNNEIGASISNSMRKEMNNRGIQIKFDEMFSLDTVDFRNQISKLKQIENLQCVFLPALSSHMVTFLKQSDELQYHPIVMSFRTMDDPTLIKNAGNLTNGLLYTTTLDLNSKTKEIEEFTSSYEKKYNETPNTYSAEGYLSAKLIIDSFVKCGDDSKCISDYLYSIKDYPSVFGPISFDRNGDVSYNYFVVEIRNGEKFNATE